MADAWGLDFDAGAVANNYVTFPAVTILGSSDFKISFIASAIASGNDFYILSQSTSDSFRYIGIDSAQLVFRWQSVGFISRNHNVNAELFNEYEIEKVGSLFTMRVNGVSIGTHTDTSVGTQPWSVVGQDGSSSGGGVIRQLSIEVDGVEQRFFKNSTSGSGSIWTDQANNQNGTLVNFPTDGSQWLIYDDGGGTGITADTAFNLPALTVQGSVVATQPQPNASGSITLTSLDVQASASNSLPNPTVNAQFNLASILVNGAVSSTQPQPNASGLLTLPKLSIAGEASVSQPSLGQWFLTFDGVDDFVSFANMQSSSNWDLDFSAWNTGADEFIVLGSNITGFSNFIILRNTNEIEYRRNNEIDRFAVNDVTDPNVDYRFEMREGTLTLFENNVAGDVRTVSLFDIYGEMNQFGRTNTQVRGGALKYLRLTDIDTPANNRDYFNDVSATSAIFPELENNQNGTLNNFDTPPSWVFYSTGGVDLSGAFSLLPVVISGNITATLPNPTVSGAFSLTALDMQGAGSSTQPNPTAQGNFDLGALLIGGGASASLPNPVGIGNFSLLPITASGVANVTEPVFIASGNFNLSLLEFSGQAATTFPQPSSQGAFSLPLTHINGNIRVSGVVINPPIDAIIFASAGDDSFYIDNSCNTLYLN